jgi:glycosyltransferase involved in cell wall biosynthesis
LKQNLKVLISAYACEPYRGSEPGVGWNWVKQISRLQEVWVITRANNQIVIETALQEINFPHKVHFIYYDLPPYLKFWKRGNRGIHLYYYFWQMGIFFVARRLHRKHSFDLIHHVTFTNYWLPSFLVFLPVKFAWGPLAGGDFTPRPFLRSFSPRGKIYEWARNFACRIFEFDPFVRLTAKRAAVALATTPQTAQRLKRLKTRRIELLSQVGLSQSELKKLETIRHPAEKMFRLLSVGNLLHLKGYHLGLAAFARMQADVPGSEYWIIGNGPERKSLEKQAVALDIENKVKFRGQIPRQEVLEKLGCCDVLVHPGLHDSGAMVCSEAMGAGLPVICLDLGGPALQVTEETGFKIPAISLEQVVQDMATAMKKLAENPELVKKMGETGHRRVAEEFNWERKGEYIHRLYQEILKNG